MPFERERAINWGREFLEELRDSGCVTDEPLEFVNDLLSQYPSPDVAAVAGTALDSSTVVVGQLPFEQLQAIRIAGLLFKELQHSHDLPPELKRQLPYVLRHWP